MGPFLASVYKYFFEKKILLYALCFFIRVEGCNTFCTLSRGRLCGGLVDSLTSLVS